MPTTSAPTSASADAVAAAKAKTQEFAHRVVEFAEYDACIKFFEEKEVDFDQPNATGSTVLMTVVARARVDLIGYVMDRTTNVESVTIPNGTTVLHLAAMATNPQVIRELTATDARKTKLKAIANSCNRNSDTPLMMACVVKNAVAAKLLVEYLDAFPSPKNASGMTALMCASRLQDEREGPAMATESAAIVSLLLAYGADVNATESAGRQTALHFALLTKNVMVIEQLLTISDINLTARNKAGHSPVALAKKLKLDDLINAAMESQWQVVEDEARVLSEQVAEELAQAAAPATTTTREAITSPQKKKEKKKKKTVGTTTATATTATTVVTSNKTKELLDVASQAVEASSAVEDPEPSVPDSVRIADVEDSGDDDWITASKKKPKRKESISSEPQPPSSNKNKTTKPSVQKHNSHTKPTKAKTDTASTNAKTGGAATKPKPTASTKQQPTAKQQSPVQSTATSQPKPSPPQPKPQPVLESKPAPWAAPAQTTSSPIPAPAPAPLQVTSQPRAHASPEAIHFEAAPFTYEELNRVFQRMFPIAEEMDIPVESFIAGAATRDATDLLGGLSISQVEMLQEAHLQAYHYLNERKIELTRILEGQRLQAQLELRRHILHLP